MSEYGIFHPPSKGGVSESLARNAKTDGANSSTIEPTYGDRADGCPVVDASPERLDAIQREILCLAETAGVPYNPTIDTNLSDMFTALGGGASIESRVAALEAETDNAITNISISGAGEVELTDLDGNTLTSNIVFAPESGDYLEGTTQPTWSGTVATFATSNDETEAAGTLDIDFAPLLSTISIPTIPNFVGADDEVFSFDVLSNTFTLDAPDNTATLTTNANGDFVFQNVDEDGNAIGAPVTFSGAQVLTDYNGNIIDEASDEFLTRGSIEAAEPCEAPERYLGEDDAGVLKWFPSVENQTKQIAYDRQSVAALSISNANMAAAFGTTLSTLSRTITNTHSCKNLRVTLSAGGFMRMRAGGGSSNDWAINFNNISTAQSGLWTHTDGLAVMRLRANNLAGNMEVGVPFHFTYVTEPIAPGATITVGYEFVLNLGSGAAIPFESNNANFLQISAQNLMTGVGVYEDVL